MHKTQQVLVGHIKVGGDAPVVVQSMVASVVLSAAPNVQPGWVCVLITSMFYLMVVKH